MTGRRSWRRQAAAAAIWMGVLGNPAAAGPSAYPAPAPVKCAVPIPPGGPAPGGKTGELPPRADSRGFDVLSYDLELEIDPAAKQVAGRVTIGLAALAPGVDRVVLDLVGNLECREVVFGSTVAAFAHQGDSLVVALPTALSEAFPETLTIDYGGRPVPHGPFDAGFLWRYHDAGTPADPTDDVPAIATVVEPSSAHSWWPCKDHPSDKALVSLAVTVPEGLIVIANGTAGPVDSPTPGWRRYRWRESYPIATYLVSIAISDYVSWSETCRPAAGPAVPLEFHAFAQDRQRAEHDLAPTCRMLELMTELAGPYPFAGEKYAQAEIKWIGAMEHQTATSISQFFLSGDGRNEAIVIHELAHQWFGDSLTPSRWADIWLNEGFARYAEGLWVEREYGAEAYRGFMLDIGSRRHPDLFAGEGTLADPDPILPNLLIYNKGGWVLHLLRMLIGDEAFFAFLRDYAGQPDLVFGNVETPRMIAVAERAAGRDLGGFFAPLLETDAVCRLETTVELAGDRRTARLTLRQLQSPLFELPVPVRLMTACGPRDRVLDLAGPAATFTLAADCPIDSLLVDPDSLSLLTTRPGLPAPLAVRGPAPNPAGAAGARFEIFLTGESHLVVKTYDMRGMNVAATDLGTLPATGAEAEPDARPHTYAWPPAAGLAAGVYWVTFEGSGRRLVRKVTLLR